MADIENTFNVINRREFAYFDSDEVSMVVYDIEINESLYKELLPDYFKDRNIHNNEIACIEYRKSTRSEEFDQFLISKFDKDNMKLTQQKEIQINDELKSQIRNVCDVYEIETNFVQKQHDTMNHSNNWDGTDPFVYTSMVYNDVKRNPELEALRLAAKAGDKDKAFDYVINTINFNNLLILKQKYPQAIVCHVRAEEASGKNKIPEAYNSLFEDYGFETSKDIVQTVTAHHTGANNIKRFVNRARFDGSVVADRQYIIIDDHVDFGGTLRDLRDFIESKGGKVVAFSTLTALEENVRILPDSNILEKLNMYGGKVDELLEQFGITDNKEGLTNGEINGLLQILADTSTDRSFETGFHRSFSVLCREIQQDFRKETRLQEKLTPVVNRFVNITKELPNNFINDSQKSQIIASIRSNNLSINHMINAYNKKENNPEAFITNLLSEVEKSKTNDLFKDFQFDFSRPVTWHFVDNTSLIYADTFISNEQALSLFNAAGANDSYNKDMQYCIQYRCTSTDKNNLVYLCKYDPNVEITTPLKEINLPEDIIQKVMSGVEAGIEEHLQQQHTIPDYLLDAVGYGDKKVVQEEVSNYSTDSNKPEGIMYLSENHNVFYAEPDLPREEYLKLSAQTDIDELKKQQSFLYTDENDDFGYQSNILEQREVYQHKIDRLQAKIDSLNGVPNPLNEIISSQLPASMTSLHSFTEEERMGQFIGMKNDFKNYATEEEIKLLDDKFKTLFVDPESSVEIKKGEEFHLLADEFESYFQDTKNKHYNVASNQYESYADVAFESDKRSVEQEVVPDFAMITQNGLKKFSGFTIQAYSDKNDIYTLSNGSETIELPGDTIKELNKPNNNEINFHGEVYSHILDQQYNDFFKYREPNTAAYFEHNLSVMIRTQAQNPLDTFKAAKEIIKAMSKTEQKKTQELVKRIAASQNKSVNDLMLDIYNKAMIERPMNEEFINVNNPRNIIPRHMTDLVYISGHKIDDNSELRIGENINKVPVKAFKLNGKKQTIYLNLEIVSASKDKNLIVMKDSKENIYELPRDKILSQYEKNSIYNRRNQSVSIKHYKDYAVER